MNLKVVGFESPSGRDIFCLKNFDTHQSTPVRCCPRTDNISNANFTLKISRLGLKLNHVSKRGHSCDYLPRVVVNVDISTQESLSAKCGFT